MNDFLQSLHTESLLLGLLLGVGLAALAAFLSWRAGRRVAAAEAAPAQAALSQRLEEEAVARQELESALAERTEALQAGREELAGLRTRLESQQQHFAEAQEQRRAQQQQHTADRDAAERRHQEALSQATAEHKKDREQAEQRLKEQFERLAGSIFEERAKRFTELSNEQLGNILKPLSKDLESFRSRVDDTHRIEAELHAALREKIDVLAGTNKQLNEEAQALTKALTGDVRSQGGWGEQQLEKLLELAGLLPGEHYHTQLTVKGQNGESLRPDLVLSLPEQRSIVIDSKVSLTAWTRYQAAADAAAQERELNDHARSIRSHIDGLARKNYADVEELNALDFVLMFVPIESALIAALRADPALPEYALQKRVALLSPANFLATVRTVASIWMVHKQNTNARDIAARAGRLYDKFVGFTGNLQEVGSRLEQAQGAYDKAFSQLSKGRGNLLNQVEDLRKLGARHQKQLDAALTERLEQDADSAGDTPLKLVTGEDDSQA